MHVIAHSFLSPSIVALTHVAADVLPGEIAALSSSTEAEAEEEEVYEIKSHDNFQKEQKRLEVNGALLKSYF